MRVRYGYCSMVRGERGQGWQGEQGDFSSPPGRRAELNHFLKKARIITGVLRLQL